MNIPTFQSVTAIGRAEQPEAPALLVLDPVIVANGIDRAGPVFGPPFLGDALGTVGAPYPIGAAAPGEAERRIVGQQPQRLDRLGRQEQADGTGGCAGGAPRFLPR